MRFIAFIVLIVCSGCVRHVAEHVRVANQLSFDYSKIVSREDKLIFSGHGGGFLDDSIQSIILSFNSVKQLDIIEARQLIICKMEEFLEMVNNNPEIRPYLHEYPFKEERVDFKIGFLKKSGDFVDPPDIAFVFTSSGIVHYSLYDSINERLEKLYSEPYAEARRIVQEQNASLCN